MLLLDRFEFEPLNEFELVESIDCETLSVPDAVSEDRSELEWKVETMEGVCDTKLTAEDSELVSIVSASLRSGYPADCHDHVMLCRWKYVRLEATALWRGRQ